MATLTFSLDELVATLNANGRMPDYIMDIKSEGDAVLATVNPPIPFISAFDVSARLESFDAGTATIHLDTTSSLAKMAGMLPMPTGMSLNWPQLTVDVNALLAKRLKKITIKSLQFTDGLFTVTA